MRSEKKIMEEEFGSARDQGIGMESEGTGGYDRPVVSGGEHETGMPATMHREREEGVFGKRKEEPNTIFVGNKPPMNYVLAVVTQFNNGTPEVHIKARGRAISRAVDVAEIVRNRFLSDLRIDSIITGTEAVDGENNEKVNVSTIDIKLQR